jgi:hypothetical protein
MYNAQNVTHIEIYKKPPEWLRIGEGDYIFVPRGEEELIILAVHAPPLF